MDVSINIEPVLLGSERVQKELRKSFIFFSKDPTPTAKLLVGTPGLGKSFSIEKVVTEERLNYKIISSTHIFNKYVGESEKQLQTVFDEAYDTFAETGNPYILIFDEVESLIGERDNDGQNESSGNIKGIFLQNLSGMAAQPGVIIIGITNLPWKLDKAFVDRCDEIFKLDLPTLPERKRFFYEFLRDKDINCDILTDEQFELLNTEMFSYRNLKALINKAEKIGPNERAISATHFRTIRGKDGGKRFIGCDFIGCNMICGGEPMNIRDISDCLVMSAITFEDLMFARKSIQASTSKEQVKQMDDWYQYRTKKEGSTPTNIPENNLTASRSPSCLVLFILFSFFILILTLIVVKFVMPAFSGEI